MEDTAGRIEHCFRTYDVLLTAVSRGDTEVAGDAMTKIFVLTEGASAEPLLAVRGYTLRIVSTLLLAQGRLDEALASLAGACAIRNALEDGEARESVAVDIAAVPLIMLRENKGKGPQRLDAAALESFYLNVLDHLLNGEAGVVPLKLCPIDRERLLVEVASDRMPLRGTDKTAVASFSFGVGMTLTDRHESGAALAWYLQSIRLLESMPDADPLQLDLAGHVYQSAAFERQRGLDVLGMRATVTRYERYLRSAGVEEGSLSREVDLLRSSMEMNHAINTDDSAGVMVHAKNLLRLMPQETLRQKPQLRALYEALARGEKPQASGGASFRAFSGHPGAEILQGALAMERALSGAEPHVEQLTVGWLNGLASADRMRQWRSAVLLMQKVCTTPEIDPSVDALGILFGKIGLRQLQFMRLEAVAQGYGRVSPFNDEMAERSMRDLIGLLSRQGRLGEALRVQLLMEGDHAKVPTPKLQDLQRAVDNSCPLTEAEQVVAADLDALGQRLGPNSQPEEFWPHLTGMSTQLLGAQPRTSHVDVPPELAKAIDSVGVVSVHVGASEVIVSLSGPWGVHSVRARTTTAELNDTAHLALRGLRHLSGEDVRPACRALHEMLIAPFDEMLTRERPHTLVVQAAGALRRIPFGVLFDGEHFLIEKHAIVLHPGVVLVNIERGIRYPVRGASLAISQAPGQPPLPAATLESDALCELACIHRVGHFDQWRDEQVTAATFRSACERNPAIFHLSCHFDADAVLAGNSAFLLGDGSQYSLSELAQLDLAGVDLMLLMGCETQVIGDIEREDGISALDTLLLRMGVGSLVSTAWPVRDDIAHEFVRAFCTALFAHSMDQAQALRHAVLAIGRDIPTGQMKHPAHWGPYTLSGGWGGIKRGSIAS